MSLHLSRKFALALLVVVILGATVTAFAAANSVPITRVGQQIIAINANALKPTECAALNLNNIVVCPPLGGNCTGSTGSDLIIGSPYADTISGGKGDDCILGGGGDDNISGDQGTDVCIGGPGNDTFKTCETVIQ